MNNIVCVALEHCYDESMGAYSIAHLWNGEEVTTEGGVYQESYYNSITATLEEVRAASVCLKNESEFWYLSESDYEEICELRSKQEASLKEQADRKEKTGLISSFIESLGTLIKAGYKEHSEELNTILNGFNVIDIITSKLVTNDDIKTILLNISNALNGQAKEQAFQVVADIKKDFNILVSLFDKGLNQRQVQYFELLSVIDTIKACYNVKQVICNGYGQLKQFKLVDGSTVGAWKAFIESDKMLRG